MESGFPYELDPNLDTLGPCDFGGRLTTAMTAHPKTDPDTGELHFFGYGLRVPYLTYHRLSAHGELVTSAEIAVKGPTMMHDFAITDRHAIFLDLPMTFRPARRGAGMPFGWDEDYGARLGVMALEKPGDVRRFDIEPGYVFHVGNAHAEPAGRIVLDAARYSPGAIRTAWDRFGGVSTVRATDATATISFPLHRWELDPSTGRVVETGLDDRALESPTLDDARVGRPARYRYAIADVHERAEIIKFDTRYGTRTAHSLDSDTVAGEAVFVATTAPDRAEDDGWLLTITARRDGSASQLLVLDATNISGKPVAAVTLPRVVPSGFHGSWIDDTQIGLHG